MKFQIDKHVLVKPLNQVSKALPGRTTIEILNGILFEVNEKGLSLTAGDSATSIMATISPDDFQLEQHGAIVLPGKKIVDIVTKAPEDISFEINGLQVTVRSGKSKFEMTGLDAEEYPAFDYGSGTEITVPGETLRSMINKTIFATSKKEETPILTGINFKFEEGKLILTGTNRHRLARSAENIENDSVFSVVIKSDSLAELLKLIDAKEEAKISFNGHKFVVKTSDFTFGSSILEGSFPDVDRIIPNDFNSVVTVNTSKLLGSLERVLIVAAEEKTNQILITVGEEVQIDSKTGSGFNASESLEIKEKKGPDFRFAVNAKYVHEALKTVESEEVSIHFIQDLSPIIFKGSQENDDLQLILPYRTGVQ